MWDSLKREAKTIERNLEEKLALYATYGTRKKTPSTANQVGDEENPSDLIKEENVLTMEIEKQLLLLSEKVDHMRDMKNLNTAQSAQLQRFREVYFDLNNEFKRNQAKIQQKRDSDRLFSRSSHTEAGHPSSDAETDVLLRERSAVDSSRSLTDSIINQAMATKSSLERQRAQFMSSQGKVTGLNSSFSNINSLVDQIKKKKLKNNTIIGLVVAGCVCFTIWWTILSKT